MPDGRRWNVSLARKFVAIGLAALGFFTVFFGIGMSNVPVAAVGLALLVVAISLIVVSAVRGGARSFVRGTAHVRDVTEPPASTPVGRCEMEIVIEAPGVAPSKIKIRDTRVPVAKWPDVGDTLPVRVAVEDPRHVRVLWDEVRTHGEEAAEEERFNEYVQRIVNAGLDSGVEHEPFDRVSGFDPAPDYGAPALVEPAGVGPTIVEPPPEPTVPRDPMASPESTVPRDPMASPESTVPPESAVPLEPSGLPPVAPNAPVRRRPSPRPRRPTASASTAATSTVATSTAATSTSAGAPAAAAPAVALAEAPDRTAPAIDDEEPVHDFAPIEGASAVLGVRPAAPSVLDAVSLDEEPPDEEPFAPEPYADATGTIRGVGVTLIVTDLARSIEFYQDMLGFRVVDAGSSNAVLASGATRIMLRCVADMPPVDRRLVHLNLEVSDVEAVYEDLRAKGVKFIHRPRPVARGDQMELWAAAFRDPDGHGIAVIRWQLKK